MTETMGVAIGIGVFALVCIYLGCLMWKKEKITLLHSYHYDKVSPSDKKVFCKISGWGVIPNPTRDSSLDPLEGSARTRPRRMTGKGRSCPFSAGQDYS